MDTLAAAQFSSGQIKEAVEAENKAIQLRPNDEALKKNLEYYQAALQGNQAPGAKKP